MPPISKRCFQFMTALVVAGIATPAAAADFYKDKTIELIVGGNAGGGYDTYARTIARHLPRHIPGNPSIVVKNMPGGASAKAATFLYQQGPKDGTMIAALYPGAIMEPLFGMRRGKYAYDARKFSYIGTANNATRVCVSWHASGTRTFDDALKRTTIVGASQSGGSTRDYANFIKRLTGAKFNVIAGYKGTVDIIVAMERGEVQGLCGYDFTSLLTQRPEWVRDKKVNLLLQLGLEPDPGLTKRGVPEIWKYLKSPEDRKALELLVSQQIVGRPYVAPPDIPADRLKTLRDGFSATMKDSAFLADAKKVRIDIEPLNGEKVQALIKKLYGSPKEIVERARQASAP